MEKHTKGTKKYKMIISDPTISTTTGMSLLRESTIGSGKSRFLLKSENFNAKVNQRIWGIPIRNSFSGLEFSCKGTYDYRSFETTSNCETNADSVFNQKKKFSSWF